MTERTTLLWYHLPKTYLTITGTATKAVGGSRRASATSEFALESRADPQAFFGVRVERSFFTDSELSLEVSEKGLLTSTTAVSTGQLGTIFKNVASFAASVAGAAVGLGAFPMTALRQPAPASAADVYAGEHPDLAQRREDIKAAIATLSDTLIGQQQSLAAEGDPDKRAETKAHVADLGAAIADLRRRAESLDQHYAAWKAAREQAGTTSHKFDLAISELPTVDAIEKLAGPPQESDLKHFFPVYEALGIVVARDDPAPGRLAGPGAVAPKGADSGQSLPQSGTSLSGAFYRKTVPMRLSLFTEKADGTLERVETETYDVVDEQSTPGYIEFKRNTWSKTTVEAGFSALGSLASLKRAKTSAAAAATGALKELPGEVLEALKQADALVDAQQKLALQGIDHRIEQLSKQKERLEGEIALAELIDSRDLVRQLKQVNAEKDLLTARKELGEARVALAAHEQTQAQQLAAEVNRLQQALASSEKDLFAAQKELEEARQALAISDATETIRTQTEILKLRQEMEQAQIDRAKVLEELRALRSEGDQEG